MNNLCTHCGQENPSKAHFCGNCGKSLKIEQEIPAREEKNFQKNHINIKKEIPEETKYNKIGGWLILYALQLIASIVLSIKTIVEFTTLENVYMVLASGDTALSNNYYLLILIQSLQLFFIIFVAFNFFLKNSKTRLLVIMLSVFLVIAFPYEAYVIVLIQESDFDASILINLIGSIFWIIVWAVYFIFSKRVKKTFIKPRGNLFLLLVFLLSMILPLLFQQSYYKTIQKYNKALPQIEKIIETETFFDEDTYLLWQDNKDTEKMMTWSEAITYCENLTLDGYDDWELPSVEILKKLDNSKLKHKKDIEYSNRVEDGHEGWYWSSTMVEKSSAHSWAVDGGYARWNAKTYNSATRCVRINKSNRFEHALRQ